jgi:NAD(P)-dependent dehydrogenase (short-subunit alcohol dehydrogenase family)
VHHHEPVSGRGGPLRSPSCAVLVTGCSSGIGRATAMRLHRAGYPVYATARRVQVLDDLAAAGMTALALDVTDEASMAAAVARVVEDHGAVAVLVNNAGYALQGTVEEVPLDQVRRQFETNVFGLVRLTQLVLPGMREQGWGRVVNIGSMGGRFTFPGGGFYHASKHAVEAISDALRLEVAPFGVTVSLVQPGPVRSGFGDSALGTIQASAGDGGAGSGIDAGPYGQFHQDLADRFVAAYGDRRADMNVSVDDVADVVLRAVASNHPRARYAVGVLAKTMITTRRLVPDPVWDRIVRAAWPTPAPPAPQG